MSNDVELKVVQGSTVLANGTSRTVDRNCERANTSLTAVLLASAPRAAGDTGELTHFTEGYTPRRPVKRECPNWVDYCVTFALKCCGVPLLRISFITKVSPTLNSNGWFES